MIARKVTPAFAGARGFDTVAVIDAGHAKALVEHPTLPMNFAVRYLGSLSNHEMDVILDSGLALIPVTYGMKHGTPLNSVLGQRYGQTSATQAKALGLPNGTTIFLDLEDCVGGAEDVAAFVNAWCAPIVGAGYVAGLYVGFSAVLSSAELYALKVTRYWQSLSKEMDTRGQIAEPNCGWCMIQLYDSLVAGGVLVDIDVIQRDYQKRVPTWVVAA